MLAPPLCVEYRGASAVNSGLSALKRSLGASIVLLLALLSPSRAGCSTAATALAAAAMGATVTGVAASDTDTDAAAAAAAVPELEPCNGWTFLAVPPLGS